jgi:transposase
VRHAIRAIGASILYLPSYSPDLNPIEQLLAKLKALLRKAAARTKDELWSAIGRLLATVPPAECANYLSHCGYGATKGENASTLDAEGPEGSAARDDHLVAE